MCLVVEDVVSRQRVRDAAVKAIEVLREVGNKGSFPRATGLCYTAWNGELEKRFGEAASYWQRCVALVIEGQSYFTVFWFHPDLVYFLGNVSVRPPQPCQVPSCTRLITRVRNSTRIYMHVTLLLRVTHCAYKR